ncbi:MAG TPA: SRPBCC family protein [Candidatus Kapabacteria bacterium]
MAIVKSSVVIHAPAEVVFDFHTDTRNLPLISPSWMKVQILKTTGEAKGKMIELYIRQFGLFKTKWIVEIAEYDRPFRITDIAHKGPFKRFCHQRDIKRLSDTSCELTDTFDYELPLGVIGKIGDVLIMKSIVRKMFRDRHIKTKQVLEKS